MNDTDIFDRSGYIVVPTNTLGIVTDNGILSRAIDRYQGVYQELRDFLRSGQHAIGKPAHSRIAPIVYFANRQHYHDLCNLGYVLESLDYIRKQFLAKPPTKDYWFPQLGKSSGVMAVIDTKPLFDQHLSEWKQCHWLDEY